MDELVEQLPQGTSPITASRADRSAEKLRRDTLENQLVYWRKQLAGAPELLDLPTDHPRLGGQSEEGRSYSVTLPECLKEKLKGLGQGEDQTFFSTLLAAFKVLLYRYSGQSDIVVGTFIANGPGEKAEDSTECFVNTLALRSNLSGDPSFSALLRQVSDVVLEGCKHRDVPFECIIDELKLPQQVNQTPFVQVMFVWHGMLSADSSTADLKGKIDEAKFDLVLEMEEAEAGLRAKFTYRAALFEVQTIERMAGHFQILLEGIVDDAERAISAFPLLTAGEFQQLSTWNETQVAYPDDLCIHTLIETQADKNPNATALVFGEKSLTYQELNNKGNQLAHYLREMGVKPEVPVGVYIDPSLEMITAVLGILKAGGAYVPLDPTYPPERINYMLHDTQTPIVLTVHASRLAFDDTQTVDPPQFITLDGDWPTIAHHATTNPPSVTAPTNTAYIIYTSGSTGRPKGVCCAHTGVLNLLASFNSYQPIGVGENVTLWTSLSFDVSVYDIFSALMTGATLHIVPQTVRPDTDAMLNWLVAHNIHSAYLPPFMLADMATWLRQAPSLPPLKRLLVGVEPIPEMVLAEIRQRIPGLQIINAYGPTEATVCCTQYLVPSDSDNENKTPIGRPVQNLDIYLLDINLQPVPVGLPGELYVGGVGLAHGYLARPGLTAAKFIPHPFSKEPGARLYKTGDLARYLPDGNILFIGRGDQQVKIRGFRIELGEIESILSQHVGVQETAVLARTLESGEKQLVAYLVPTFPQHPPTVNEIRDFLKETLPGYMVPAVFATLESFPLTPNGKIDRNALPAPDLLSPLVLEGDFVAPEGIVEERVASIWCRMLGIDKVSVYDTFFDLGGYSLLATQIIHQINEAFSVNLSLRDLFEEPTIAGLSLRIEEILLERFEESISTESE